MLEVPEYERIRSLLMWDFNDTLMIVFSRGKLPWFVWDIFRTTTFNIPEGVSMKFEDWILVRMRAWESGWGLVKRWFDLP
jgi:hypothetical protein